MILQRLLKNALSGLGYRVERTSTYEHLVADEARQLVRRIAQRMDVEATSHSSLSAEEYEFLHQLVDEANSYAGPIIEIGTLFGRTTSKIALWKAPQKKILTIDNYVWNPLRVSPEMHFRLTSLVLQYLVESGQVEQIRSDKDPWFAHYDREPPALVFCDADHSFEATDADIRFAEAAGAKIICGHDYSLEHPGTIRAVDAHGGPRGLRGTLWTLQAPLAN
jgi:hypothetical protein